MRKRELYGMERAAAVDLLARAHVVHLAAATERGEPVLRAFHAVVVDGAIAFHAAPAGEKMEALGQPAVLSADEVVATIPSYVFDPERACPATTYYRSAQVHGTLEAVEAPAEKARVLQAFMEKYQPEGGYAPISAEDPRYRGMVRGLLIARMSLERVDGKAKLGQNRGPEDLARVLEFLWKRGEPGDLRAIDLVREANPELGAPAFLAVPAGARLVCAPTLADADAAGALLVGQYWNEGVPQDILARSQRGASAWLVARDDQGALIGTARAMSDGVRRALVCDVIVAPAWRGRGLGQALVRATLDHPAVRGAREVRLRTRDAHELYRRFGFREVDAPPYPEMALLRG